ncbi:FG-GAP-like repeat-containing protein [Streptomyces sp. Je 1-79]|uniref:FG-GAP-like repeat-containing protein n=1 Tax=Streptomyces sp. Je 1-79 TaxID=2943847 RepID=UPI0021A2BDBD|nr:FG-GAP-like repeat-containing protein [Streptomyces sp. Je 1-79]MCT4355448.1 FG-GAP-like repeat-containing protein [Streptomyces sp. Je 1-79]
MVGTSRARRALGAAVATLASLATLVTAAPNAAADSSRCPSGKLCVFQYPEFKGQMKIISSSQSTLGVWDNSISSLVNNSGLYASASTGPNHTGEDSLHISPHNGAIDLGGGAFDGRLDNKISSIRVATTDYELSYGVPWMDWLAPSVRPEPTPVTAFGDLDGNWVPDLLHRAEDGRLWFLPGNAPKGSTSAPKGRLIGGGWNAMTLLVRHGDHNGDGNEDVFARDKAGVLWFYPGSGLGSLKARVKVGGGWNTMREIEAVGDITGDGRRDLVARDTAGVLWTYPGNGRGSFSARKQVGGGWNAMNRLVAPGDMNGDGKADLVARDGSRSLWLYPGNGRGTFGARTKLPYAWSANEELLTVGDVTGDGLSDLMRTINFHDLYIDAGNGRGGIGAPSYQMSFDSADGVQVF